MKTNIALRNMDSALWITFKKVAKKRKSTIAEELEKLMREEIKNSRIYKAYIQQNPKGKTTKNINQQSS